MKKLLVGLLTAVCMLCAVFGFTACSGGKDGVDGVNGKDGINGTNGEDGKDGKDGIGIKNVEINSDGELVITLSDDTSKNVGKVAGKNGENGKDGLGIKDVKFDADGSMVVIFTDDTSKNLGKIPYCKHDFDEWQTVLEATCTSIGYSTHECQICGYVEYNFTEAKGHKWDDGVEFSGKILKTCMVCNATQIEEKQQAGPLPDIDDGKLLLPIENAEIICLFEALHQNETGQILGHTGLDFAGQEGINVCASLSGNVTQIVNNHILGENFITIEHANGMITTYKYIVPLKTLKVGDTVNRGDIVGTVAAGGGYSESVRGAHIHFELKVDGKTVDPTKYFKEEDLKYADGVK